MRLDIIMRVLVYLSALYMIAMGAYTIYHLITDSSGNSNAMMFFDSGYFMYFIFYLRFFGIIFILGDLDNKWIKKEFGFFTTNFGRGCFCGLYFGCTY